jgi:hypothetical protein
MQVVQALQILAVAAVEKVILKLHTVAAVLVVLDLLLLKFQIQLQLLLVQELHQV